MSVPTSRPPLTRPLLLWPPGVSPPSRLRVHRSPGPYFCGRPGSHLRPDSTSTVHVADHGTTAALPGTTAPEGAPSTRSLSSRPYARLPSSILVSLGSVSSRPSYTCRVWTTPSPPSSVAPMVGRDPGLNVPSYRPDPSCLLIPTCSVGEPPALTHVSPNVFAVRTGSLLRRRVSWVRTSFVTGENP